MNPNKQGTQKINQKAVVKSTQVKINRKIKQQNKKL
jgi:hypothetical protein